MFGSFGNSNQQNTGTFGSTQQPQQGNSFNTAGQQPVQTPSLFGGSTPQSSGPFGNTSGAPATTGTGGGPFGNFNQTQLQTGTIGSTQQQPGGGSLFGNATTQQQPVGITTAPQAQTSSLFGNTGQQQPVQTPSLFGGSTPQSSGPFGNTSGAPATTGTGGGAFGNFNQTQLQTGTLGSTQQQPGGGNLFGNATTQQQPVGITTAPQAQTSSLFGNTGQQQPVQTPSLFGGSTPQSSGPFGNTSGAPSATGTGGMMFGNTNQTQPQPGTSVLFGSAQQPGGGSLFGNNTAQQQPIGSTTAPQSQTSSLFGDTGQQQPVQTPSLFGGSAPQSSVLFGNTSGAPATTGIGGAFGNLNQTQLQTGTLGSTQQQPGGRSLFGNATTQQQPIGITTAPQAQTSSLFGNTTAQSQQPASGGLFGSTTTQPSAGGSLFGTTTNSSNPLLGGKAPTTLFGQSVNSTTAPSNPPSIFGNLGQTQNSQQQPQQQTGSFFSQPSQTQPTGSLFGQSNATSKPSGSLFGNTPAPGVSASNGMLLSNSRMSIGPTQQQADAQSQTVALQQKIEYIYNAWNSGSIQCRFQHFFYNLVDPQQVNLYGRPPNATNEVLWQKAVRENPDPSCLVPVIAIGFDDLQQRVAAQSSQATAHQDKLKELKSRIKALSQRHEISNVERLDRASTLQTQITHRLLKLIQHLHLFIPALRSSAIRPEEEALRGVLEEIEETIRAGRVHGKLNELWALLGAVNAARERGRDGESRTEWTVVDEEGLGQIAQILSEQQIGLEHLTKILQRDLKDLAVIQGEGVKEDDPDHLLNPASTLRSSTLQ